MLVIFVFRLGSKMPCMFLFLIISCGSRAFLFLVEPVPFLFLFFLVYYNSLALDSSCKGLGVECFSSFDLSNVY